MQTYHLTHILTITLTYSWYIWWEANRGLPYSPTNSSNMNTVPTILGWRTQYTEQHYLHSSWGYLEDMKSQTQWYAKEKQKPFEQDSTTELEQISKLLTLSPHERVNLRCFWRIWLRGFMYWHSSYWNWWGCSVVFSVAVVGVHLAQIYKVCLQDSSITFTVHVMLVHYRCNLRHMALLSRLLLEQPFCSMLIFCCYLIFAVTLNPLTWIAPHTYISPIGGDKPQHL